MEDIKSSMSLLDGEHALEKKPKKRSAFQRAYKRMQDAGLIRVFWWFFLTVVLSFGGAFLFRWAESDKDLQNRLENASGELYRVGNCTIYRAELVTMLRTGGRQNLLGLDYQSDLADLLPADRIRVMLEAYERLVNISTKTPKMAGPRWTFQNAMFFCCSLYNSLGFGNRLAPVTTYGMVVTMIYSFIGIPFMLAMTSDLGLVVFDCVYACWWKVMTMLRSTPQAKERIKKQREACENVELFRKEMSTLPVYYGIVMSGLSLALCSGLVLLIEPDWSYFQANYYYVTSFLTIGLGDISPSAPNNCNVAEMGADCEWTLLPHTILLIFCMTFIGLAQHVMDRRIELVFATIENGIHVHFRNMSDDTKPSAGQGQAEESAEADEEATAAADLQIAKIAARMGFMNRMYYGMMDQSRSRLLQEIWHRKAKMKNMNNQTRAPKRDVGCQHLNPVDDETDIAAYGDYLGPEYAPKKKDADNIKLVKYLYNCD